MPQVGHSHFYRKNDLPLSLRKDRRILGRRIKISVFLAEKVYLTSVVPPRMIRGRSRSAFTIKTACCYLDLLLSGSPICH